MDFIIEANNYKGLTEDLKNSLWTVAVVSAPYRTGNLRSSIKKISMSKNRVMYAYSEQQAYYTDFLEQGIGRNKKHIGFIENITVGSMVQEIADTARSGSTTFKGIPMISFRTDKARNYERQMLRKMGISPDIRISAVERATFSMLRYAKGKRKNNRFKFDLARYGNKVENIKIENLEQQLASNRFNNRGGGR